MSGTFQVGEATIEASAAVGAALVPWAGARADLLQLDSVGAEGLRVSPAAAAVEIRVPFGGWAAARIDTGTDWQARTPGIGVELAEAQLGWMEPGGIVALRAGRTHIGF